MRIFITGGSGFVGWNIAKSLKSENEVIWTYNKNVCSMKGTESSELDITNRESVSSLIKDIKPDITIHTVAIPSVDFCETNHDMAKEVNVEGTKSVVDACRNVKSKLLFVSTTYVFNGKKPVYYENDETNPVNFYGYTKNEAEKIVISSGVPYIIARLDQPYGWTEKWQKKNSVVRALEKMENNEEINEITDWYNTPTFIEDFAKCIGLLIKNKSHGIYHVVGPEFTNRYDWTLKVAQIFGRDKSLVKPIRSSLLNLPAKRPAVHAKNDKIEKEFKIKLMDIEKSLEYMKSTR